MRSILILILLIQSLSANCFSQNDVDDLLKANDTLEGEARIKNLINIARLYMIQEDTTGIRYAHNAIDLARNSEYKQGVGMAMLFLGLTYEYIDIEKAIDYLIRSSDTLMNIHHDWAGFGYENAARIYQSKGWYPEALDLSLKALKAYERAMDTSQLVKTMSGIGYINDLTGNHREAIKWQRKAFNLLKGKDIPELTGLIVGRIGISYDEMGMYDSANYYNEEAINLFRKAGDSFYLGQWISNVGNTLIKQEKYAEAEDYLKKALDLSEASDEKTIILINLGKIYIETGRANKANEILNTAIEEAKKNDQRKFLSEAYYRKYELFKKLNRPQRALEYYLLHSKLQDSILNEKKTRIIADLKIKYQTEQKEKELLAEKAEKERLAKEKALSDIKVYNRNKWIIGISTLSLIIIFSGLALNQRKRRKMQAERDAAIIEEREKGISAVFDAQEEERQRIAKDLHDGVGQQISAVKIHLQGLDKEMAGKFPEQGKKLQFIIIMISETGSDVRNISHKMMPRALSELGLVSALEDMLEKSFKYHNINYSFDHYGMEERLPRNMEIGLYRIAQELVNNIIKHAGAQKVDVQLMKTETHCILIVQDDGKGIDSDESQDGIGMMNISNRLRTLKGEMNMESDTGHGTTATIRIALS